MIHERHAMWLENRGLDPALCAKLGIETIREPDGVNWLRVPYSERGQVVNHKFRLTKQKRHKMDAGAPLTLWNHDCLLDRTVTEQEKPVVMTEGEWDALAVIQSGYPWAVSVPNGASASGEAKLEYIDRCQSVLKPVRWIILATDNDDAGLRLREELARRLGPWRCKFIEYPEDCKDLNEVLLGYSSAEVMRIVNEAKPYPIQGLYDFEDIPEPPPIESIDIGIPLLRDHISIVPGTLTVFTGWAGAGKTALSMAIIGNLIRAGIGVALGSFETMPKPVLQTRLRAAIMQVSEWDAKTKDMRDADDLLKRHFSLIYQRTDDDQAFTVDQVLNLAATAVLRKGIRLLWIDPWNEMEHKREPGESETDYIGRSLRSIRRFSSDYGVATWITAHPGKPTADDFKRGPSLYTVSGSAHWGNKPDYGMVLRRPNRDSPIVEVEISKVRIGLPGKMGKVELQYDHRTSEYREPAQYGDAQEDDREEENLL